MIGGYYIEPTPIPTYTGTGTIVNSYKASYGTCSYDPRCCGLIYIQISNVKSGDTLTMNSTSYAVKKSIIGIE